MRGTRKEFFNIFFIFFQNIWTFFYIYGFVDNIPDQKESILWALLKLKLNWVLANNWWIPHDQGVDLACRYALLPWEAGPTSQEVRLYKPQLFIPINALVSFGGTWAPVHCAHPSFYAHLQAQKGAAPPSPNPLLFLSSSHSLYTTMRLEIFIILFLWIKFLRKKFDTYWNRTREPALKSVNSTTGPPRMGDPSQSWILRDNSSWRINQGDFVPLKNGTMTELTTENRSLFY